MTPSLAMRPARLAAWASPFFRRISTAFSRSPPDSSSAALQSIMPAPVLSRSSLTAAADAAITKSPSFENGLNRAFSYRLPVGVEPNKLADENKWLNAAELAAQQNTNLPRRSSCDEFRAKRAGFMLWWVPRLAAAGAGDWPGARYGWLRRRRRPRPRRRPDR